MLCCERHTARRKRDRCVGLCRIPMPDSFAIVLLTVLVLLMTGCRRNDKHTCTIAVIPKTTATNVWKAMHGAVLAEAARCGCLVEWNAPESEANYTQQASMVESAVREHVDGIVLAPAHQLVLASSVRKAHDAGIPVVIVDAPIALASSDYTTYIGSNDQEIGKIAADRIGKLTQGRGEVAILGVSPTMQGSTTTEQAFEREIENKFPAMTIEGVAYGLSDWERSMEATADLLGRYPRLNAIFATDGFATSGAASYLQQRHGASRVLLVGVGQEGDIMNAVRTGGVDALIMQDSKTMGYQAIRAIVDKTRHNAVPDRIEVPVLLVDKSNLDSGQVERLLPSRGNSP